MSEERCTSLIELMIEAYAVILQAEQSAEDEHIKNKCYHTRKNIKGIITMLNKYL